MSTPIITRSPAHAVTVIGRHVRTTPAASAQDIPALWSDVTSSGILETIPGRTAPDTYAVYTNLEHAGRTNDGWFSFIIGVSVAASTPVPRGLVLVTIPPSPRASFPVPGNDPARVLEAWQQAWAYDDAAKTFLCEYEHYRADGVATVNIGLRLLPG